MDDKYGFFLLFYLLNYLFVDLKSKDVKFEFFCKVVDVVVNFY